MAVSTNKLLIILISLLIVIIIGGAATFVFYVDKEDKVIQATTTQEKQLTNNTKNTEEETLTEVGPLYPIAPITVNLKNQDAKDIYLKITLSLELSDKLLANELDAKNAVIRDNIILILSSKSVDDLSSEIGKAEVCDEIKKKLNSLLDDGKIKNVYIVSFVIE